MLGHIKLEGVEKHSLASSLQRMRTQILNCIFILVQKAKEMEHSSERLFIKYNQVKSEWSSIKVTKYPKSVLDTIGQGP